MTDNDKLDFIYQTLIEVKRDVKSSKHHLFFNSLVTAGLFVSVIIGAFAINFLFSNIQSNSQGTYIQLHNNSNSVASSSNKSKNINNNTKTEKKGLWNK